MRRSDLGGEQIVPERLKFSAEDRMLYLIHEVSYRYAAPYVAGKDVLDLGCGGGYGTAILAEGAKSVVGVDVSEAAVEHAGKTFEGNNIRFRTIGGQGRLPFADRTFDVVSCLQVIEHIRGDRLFAAEIARVLKPGGVAIIATPDRASRLFWWQQPWNRFHVREYSARRFQALLRQAFAGVEVHCVNGRPDAVAVEIGRCRRFRWLSIPATLPLLPGPLRWLGLTLMRALRPAARPSSGSGDFGLSIDDLWVGPQTGPSMSLLAVARKAA